MALAGEIADPAQYGIDIRKRVRRGRSENSSSGTTTEVGVLRLDGVDVTAGHSYLIHVPPVLTQSTVANDVVGLALRISSTGTATTSSATLVATQARRTGASTFENCGLGATYTPAADEVLSILLTVSRSSGTGTASIVASASSPIELLVDDGGVDPGNTGVAV